MHARDQRNRPTTAASPHGQIVWPWQLVLCLMYRRYLTANHMGTLACKHCRTSRGL